jgi:hypothetical protein
MVASGETEKSSSAFEASYIMRFLVINDLVTMGLVNF